MSEDISGAVKLGIVTLMLATVVVAAANLSYFGNNLWESYANEAMFVKSNMEYKDLMGLNEQYVSAPVIYRVLMTHEGAIGDFAIRVNGSTYDDVELLLHNASKIFKVNIKIEGGKYGIVLDER